MLDSEHKKAIGQLMEVKQGLKAELEGYLSLNRR